jgi:hypothetical protein
MQANAQPAASAANKGSANTEAAGSSSLADNPSGMQKSHGNQPSKIAARKQAMHIKAMQQSNAMYQQMINDPLLNPYHPAHTGGMHPGHIHSGHPGGHPHGHTVHHGG